MKKTLTFCAISMVIAVIAFLNLKSTAVAQTGTVPKEEYLSLVYVGRFDSYVIRPDGKVEFLSDLANITNPERTDVHIYLINIAMNRLGKEGYEFAWKDGSHIVMKRTVFR